MTARLFSLTRPAPAPAFSESLGTRWLCDDCYITGGCWTDAAITGPLDPSRNPEAHAARPSPGHCESCGADDPTPCCPDCYAMTGGANGADARPALDGESCCAADCDGDPRAECECCRRLSSDLRTYDGGALLCESCYSADMDDDEIERCEHGIVGSVACGYCDENAY